MKPGTRKPTSRPGKQIFLPRWEDRLPALTFSFAVDCSVLSDAIRVASPALPVIAGYEPWDAEPRRGIVTQLCTHASEGSDVWSSRIDNPLTLHQRSEGHTVIELPWTVRTLEPFMQALIDHLGTLFPSGPESSGLNPLAQARFLRSIVPTK